MVEKEITTGIVFLNLIVRETYGRRNFVKTGRFKIIRIRKGFLTKYLPELDKVICEFVRCDKSGTPSVKQIHAWSLRAITEWVAAGTAIILDN